MPFSEDQKVSHKIDATLNSIFSILNCLIRFMVRHVNYHLLLQTKSTRESTPLSQELKRIYYKLIQKGK